MVFGFSNSTTITAENISYITNSSDYIELIIKGNEIMFGGMAFFILLCVFFIILLSIFQQSNKDEFLLNLMVTSTITTIASLFFRAAEIYVYGVKKGLLNDKLLWIFPLIMFFSASLSYLLKDR